MDNFEKNNIKEAIKNELSKFKKLIEFNGTCEYEVEIVQILEKIFLQEPFQTLNKRYQLGLLNHVDPKWKNVKHTRLDHSIGVATKCLVVSSILNKNSDPIRLEFNDILELCISASLHDIAHLPYSHAFERGILSLVKYSVGVSHEDRVAPLLVQENSYFKGVRDIIIDSSTRDNKEHSILKIICLISPEMGIKHTKKIEDFKWPFKAVSQLLSSDIDIDRVDYILRDTEAVNYQPVVKIHKEIISYLKYLTLKKIKLIDKSDSFGEYELCIPELSLGSVFNLLVSRVLLYKNVYFSRKVRAFEANLTELVGKLVECRIPLYLLELSTMGDDEFRDVKLKDYVSKLNLDITEEQRNSIESYVDAIQNNKIKMFAFVISINENIFKKHPRIRQEYLKNINSRKYIQNLKSQIVKYLNEQNNGSKYNVSEFLFDIFNLKTGGGELLVIKETNKGVVYRTLKDYMNGSNIARLCEESRIDIYLNSHYDGEGNVEEIKDQITSFFDQYN